MLVRLTHHGSITADIEATVTWTGPFAQANATAELFIERSNAAFNSGVIRNDGGTLAEIFTPYGRWTGVADRPIYAPEGWRLPLKHITVWAEIRNVGMNRRIFGATAGDIARMAFRDAIGGTHLPVTLGPILHAPPHINEYEFTGQSLRDVLTFLSEWTGGQEWTITERLQFVWTTYTGRHHTETMVDDGSIFGELQVGTLADRYMEVTDRTEDGEGRMFTAYEMPMFWPSQKTEDV